MDMALAFVIRHPAITAAIVGPRTVQHIESLLPAMDVVLSDEIDWIVPPGTTLSGRGYAPPSITDASTRRR